MIKSNNPHLAAGEKHLNFHSTVHGTVWKPRPSPCYGDVIGVQGSSESGRGGDVQVKKRIDLMEMESLMG